MIGYIFILFLNIQNADSLIENAIQLYKTRHLEAGNLQKSVEVLQNINEPDNLKLNYELSKIYSLLGDVAKTKKEKLEFYNKGIEYAKKALEIDGNSEWAHFWYMVNSGKIGQMKGILNSIGIVSEIKREIETVLKINPKNTDALLARASLYYELPTFLGGDLNKSIKDLNRAIEIDSNYTALYVDMGKIYIKKKDYKKAEEYLNKVLKVNNPTSEADYILNDKSEVIRLLKKISEKL